MKKYMLAVIAIICLIFSSFNMQIDGRETRMSPEHGNPSIINLTIIVEIVIDSDDDFDLTYGFPGNGTSNNPYIIENYWIFSAYDDGAIITNTTKFFVIRNCYVDAAFNGLFIYDVAEGTVTITNNTFSSENNLGIRINNAASSTITNNTCIDNFDHGIFLINSGNSIVANNTCSGSYYSCILITDSESTTITNNTCFTCYYDGIELYHSASSTVTDNNCSNNGGLGIDLYISGNSTVANNTCNNNAQGIIISNSLFSIVANNTCSSNDLGICIGHSDSITIANNTCGNNFYAGISLGGSDFCVITDNLLQDNTGYGIGLDSDSNDNLIHHNIFVDNMLGGTSQAYDDGANNYWYDTQTQEGNDWSDWVSGPYSIDGSSGAVDLYPLGVPVVAEYPQIILLTLVFSIVPFLIIKQSQRKQKKNRIVIRNCIEKK